MVSVRRRSLFGLQLEAEVHAVLRKIALLTDPRCRID
jgi:hypothetical protein